MAGDGLFLGWVEKAMQQIHCDWPATLQDKVDDVGAEFYLEQRFVGAVDSLETDAR